MFENIVIAVAFVLLGGAGGLLYGFNHSNRKMEALFENEPLLIDEMAMRMYAFDHSGSRANPPPLAWAAYKATFTRGLDWYTRAAHEALAALKDVAGRG